MRSKNTAGFTLVEVMITLAVMAAVFVLFQGAINSLLLNRRVAHQELALRIAATKMEQLRSLTYETLPESGPWADPLLASLPQGAASSTISNYDAATKQVAVTVAWWEDSNQAWRDVTLTTLVTQGGL